jgi:hypothetical protein
MLNRQVILSNSLAENSKKYNLLEVPGMFLEKSFLIIFLLFRVLLDKLNFYLLTYAHPGEKLDLITGDTLFGKITGNEKNFDKNEIYGVPKQ